MKARVHERTDILASHAYVAQASWVDINTDVAESSGYLCNAISKIDKHYDSLVSNPEQISGTIPIRALQRSLQLFKSAYPLTAHDVLQAHKK